MNLLILGFYNEATCKTLESTSLLLTETCVNLGTSSVYASTSGEFQAFHSSDCTGSAAQTAKLDTCVNVGGPSVKTSLVNAKSFNMNANAKTFNMNANAKTSNTNAVSQTWVNATSCSGAPSLATIMSSNSSLFAGMPCMSTGCSCVSGTCVSMNTCSNDTISTIGSAFGSKSYLQVGKSFPFL